MTALAIMAAWFAVSIGCGLLLGACVPSRTNSSREIDAYQRRRSMGDQPSLPFSFHADLNASERQHDHVR